MIDFLSAVVPFLYVTLFSSSLDYLEFIKPRKYALFLSPFSCNFNVALKINLSAFLLFLMMSICDLMIYMSMIISCLSNGWLLCCLEKYVPCSCIVLLQLFLVKLFLCFLGACYLA
jgi:hypothetical protein